MIKSSLILSLPLAIVSFSYSSAQVGVPTISDPAAVDWETVETEGGHRMIFTVYDDAVLTWDDFQLDSNSELVFLFEGGFLVSNYLLGTGIQSIGGTVTANGAISFIAPHAPLHVGGEITATEVTLSTLLPGANSVSAAEEAGHCLFINGRITATKGDVFLSSESVVVFSDGVIQASDRAVLAGGLEVHESSDFEGGVGVCGDGGIVLVDGRVDAPTVIEKAVDAVHNSGVIGRAGAQVYIEVGASGQISKGVSAVVHGSSWTTGTLIRPEDQVVVFHEGDSTAVVNDATLKIPMVRRPSGEMATGEVEIRKTSPMTASSDHSRDRHQHVSNAGTQDSPVKKLLMTRSSFFGVRGGAEPSSYSKNSISKR